MNATKKIGLFYSFNTRNTSVTAGKIAKAIGIKLVDKINVEELDEETFSSYDFIILGVPTWWDGELPNYWDEFLPAIEDMDLKGKTIALFGHGDQKAYPQNFADAIGIMADILQERGAKIIGEYSLEGYTFEKSKAVRGDKFIGLVLDSDNQPGLTDKRVVDWVKMIKQALM